MIDPPHSSPVVISVLCVGADREFVRQTATRLSELDEQLVTHTATSATGAIEQFEEVDVDCIVSDREVSDVDGLTLLQTVRADHPDLPFVLYTGDGSEQLASDAISAGVTDYVKRAQTQEEHEHLVQRIRTAVDRYRVRHGSEYHETEGHEAEDHGITKTDPHARAVLEAAPDAIVVNVSGKIAYANHAAVELFDVDDRADLLDLELPVLVSSGNSEELLAHLEPVRRGAEPFPSLRRAVRTTNGESVPVELTARQIDWGDETGVVVVLREVGDRQRRESELAEKRRQLSSVLDTVSAAIFIKDRDGRYLLMNRNCRELLGLDPDEDVVGLTDEDLFSDGVASQYRTDDERVFETGETVEIEEEIPTANGTRIHLTRKTPIFEGEGNPYALCAVSTDITEQHERERELRERVKELSAIHHVVELFSDRDRPISTLLAEFVGTLPESFQYPEVTAARIRCGDEVVETGGFESVERRLSAETETVEGTRIELEVGYLDAESAEVDGPSLERGIDPFLDEERDLVETLTRFVGVHVERREDIEALERDETILRALGDPVYALDADGNLEYVNDALVERSGYSRSELVGEHISKILPGTAISLGRDRIEELLEDEERDAIQIEMDLVTAEDETVPCETQIVLLPFDEEGSFRGTAGVIRDISRRKENELELQRQRDFLLRTEELATVGGWELDLETDTLRWTDGTRSIHDVGTSSEPTIEEAFEFYHPDDRPTIRDAVTKCRREGVSFDLELRLVTASGSERWVHVRGERVEENGASLLRGTIQDVTDSKESEQQLMVLNRVLRHNLRNNLNVVTLNAVLVREDIDTLQQSDFDHDTLPFPIEETRNRLDHIEDYTLDLIHLAEKARRLGETIEGSDGTVPVPVRPLLSDVASTYREEYPDATIELDVPDLQVIGNPDAVDMAVRELLDNALQHSDRKEPTVWLSASESADDRVEIHVADDGPGIPDMEREVLERGTETALEHGSGLGLWTVHWLLRRLGGTVTLAENDPRGTVATIDLPATSGKRGTHSSDDDSG